MGHPKIRNSANGDFWCQQLAYGNYEICALRISSLVETLARARINFSTTSWVNDSVSTVPYEFYSFCRRKFEGRWNVSWQECITNA